MATFEVGDGNKSNVEITKTKPYIVEVNSQKPYSTAVVSDTKNGLVELTEYGTAGPPGPTGPMGPQGSGGALAYYASFYSTERQQIAANTNAPMRLNQIAEARGISVLGQSMIAFEHAGTYDLQFSAQAHHIGGGGTGLEVDIWFAKNGEYLSDSATKLIIPKGEYLVPAWDYLITVEDNDYLEIFWRNNNNNIVLEYSAATVDRPAIPSLIVTVTQVTYTQIGPTGSAGPRGASILTGVGTPTSNVGANGDLYLDTSTGDYYGPKESGQWPNSPISAASLTRRYVFDQPVATATWNITHALGGRPAVTVVDSAGTTVIGEVVYNSDTSITVLFSAPFSGQAYLT